MGLEKKIKRKVLRDGQLKLGEDKERMSCCAVEEVVLFSSYKTLEPETWKQCVAALDSKTDLEQAPVNTVQDPWKNEGGHHLRHPRQPSRA